MSEINSEVMEQLEQAQAELGRQSEIAMTGGGPPVEAEVAAHEVEETTFGAGSGQAKHVLMDHYFTSSLRRLWAYAGNNWRNANVTTADEQGIAQVAFAANRVDAWWDNNNKITILRCWKNL